LDNYLQNAAIPALNRLGSKPIGAFTEIENKDALAVYVLVPYATLEAFAGVAAGLRQDAEYHKTGTEYLQTSKDTVSLRLSESIAG
jgi:hypothetical protein